MPWTSRPKTSGWIAIGLFTFACLLTGCGGQSDAAGHAVAGQTKSGAQQPAAGSPAAQPAAQAGASRSPGPRPNILIFLIDTVRADHLNCYGYSKYTTSPAIDALAAEGVLFEQAYAPGPWTLPTVASLMTGKPLCEHQTLAPRESLPPDLETLPQRLKRLDYTTLGLFANGMVSPQYGFERGYDLYRNSTRNDGPKITPVLDQYPGSPFFLYVHNLEPHNPYHFAPPRTPGIPDVGPQLRQQMQTAYKGYRKASRVDYDARRPLGAQHASDLVQQHMDALNRMRTEFVDLYDATLLVADAKLGSTIEMLKARNQWENTLAIFLSDHGEEFGEHGGWLHDQSVYEELLRVPLIIKFPGGQFAGQRVKTPVTLLDVLPTVAELLGEPAIAAGGRGASLLPFIRGEVNRDEGWHVVAMRHNRERYFEPWKKARGDVNLALRSGSWKAIWNVELDTVELYDLAADAHETKNLAADHATIVSEARRAAKAWYDACLSDQQSANESVDEKSHTPEELKALQQLGYLGGAGDDDEDDDTPKGDAPASQPADPNPSEDP